jgi:hypothetical protein
MKRTQQKYPGLGLFIPANQILAEEGIINMKKTVKYMFILIFSVIIMAPKLHSEGGSNYSIYGVGDILGANGAFYQALGGTSLAMPAEDAINVKNPALWGFVSKTRLSIGYRFSQLYVSQGKESLYQNNGSVDAIAGVFSIDTSIGLSASFGLVPYSHVDYMSINPLKVYLEGIEVQGKTTYKGKGGLSIGYLGASVSPFNGLYLGASVFANFGSVSSSIVTDIYDNTAITTYTLKDDNYIGSGIRAGLFYQLGGLGIGAYYEKQIALKVNSRQRYFYFNSDIDTTLSFETDYTMPDAFGAGLSFRADRLLFGADINLQDYSKFNYQLGPKTKFKDYMNFSLGISRTGSKLAGAKYLDKTDYNIGFGYKQLYYRILDTDINEMYGSFGMSMPVMDNTKIDWALVIGSRGTSKNGLVSETFANLLINVSIGEIWFKPFKHSYE